MRLASEDLPVTIKAHRTVPSNRYNLASFPSVFVGAVSRHMRNLVGTVALAVVLASASWARADIIAYDIPAPSTGTQDFNGSLGMDFDVISASGIVISQLGVFDSDQDGLAEPITAEIWLRTSDTTGTLLQSQVFAAGNTGSLIGGSRFLDTPDLFLLPGTYSVVAFNYQASELNGNQGSGFPNYPTNDGGGAIAFVGVGRFAFTQGAFPDMLDSAPSNRYGAGTFQFQAQAVVPEPSSLTLLGFGAVGLVGYVWKRRRNNKTAAA